ncbi:MAG: hydrogenase maturation nickel metallochaperone HypA [Planctomycetes bacterium]|jgi:hydrogenase nickel incorporation protein HypA/HybF|nr:hydrogenase maturation nickel metallochaperone HypA [Planctomycetota bacterium]
MHEMAVAESILHTIIEQADRLGGARPVAARISCGQFNALNDETMRFAFESISQGTPCEGMRLEIRHIPLQAECTHCRTVFVFDIYHPMCPTCKSSRFDFQPDAPLLLEDIEFKEPHSPS